MSKNSTNSVGVIPDGHIIGSKRELVFFGWKRKRYRNWYTHTQDKHQ
mgnify:CR=1 FL=1